MPSIVLTLRGKPKDWIPACARMTLRGHAREGGNLFCAKA